MDIRKKVGKVLSEKAKNIDVDRVKGTVAEATSILGDGLKKVSETLEPKKGNQKTNNKKGENLSRRNEINNSTDRIREAFTEATASLSEELNENIRDSSSIKEKIVIKEEKKIYISQKLENLEKRGKSKKSLGYILIFIGVISALNLILTFTFNVALVFSIGFIVVGIYFTENAQIDKKMYKNYFLYYQCFGSQEFATFDDLAISVNGKKEDVVADFHFYISEHILVQTHIDQKKEKIYITDNSFERSQLPDIPTRKEDGIEKQQELPNEVKEFIQNIDDYLERIEKDNVDIENIEVSSQLDYLVIILTKIRDHIKKHPSSLSDTNQLMNYYLPMTMDLLENYKELDDGNLLGENRLKSKSNIEKTLYTLNDALNNLYDEMYQNITMDVRADISVLETLLEQDGLKNKADVWKYKEKV